MPHPSRQLPLGRLTPTLIAALAVLHGFSARADEPSPYYVGVSEALTHDNNVFRTATPISDTYSTTSLLGGFDQSIGRQHFYGAANVGFSKYHGQSALDNTSYGVNAGWDWQTINDLSGSVGVSANQSLATQNGNQALVDANGNLIAPSSARNLVKTEQVTTGLRWGGAGPYSLGGSYSHSKVDYSNSVSSESTGDTAGINATYRVGPTVTTGVGLRYTRSRSPFGIALVANPTGPDDYTAYTSTGRNLDLSLGWRISAQTGVDARLSFTRQSYSTAGSQEFSGLTGGVSANYAPTAKTTFSASYSRDTGANGNFFNAPVIIDPNTGAASNAALLLSQNSTVSDSVGLTAGYALTSKITTTAGVQYRRSRSETSFSGAGSDYTDRLRSGTLSASYAAGRAWSLGCNVSHEKRDVSGVNSIGYSDTTVGCSVQLTLR
jgi:hypothetical protein